MSSSVFIESQSTSVSKPASRSEKIDSFSGNITANTSADSNLVVVYGKNGINFDRKGLENLIEEKTLSSISVIRLTSPTPSMEDEEEEAEKIEDMLRRQTIDSDEDVENTSDKETATEDEKQIEDYESELESNSTGEEDERSDSSYEKNPVENDKISENFKNKKIDDRKAKTDIKGQKYKRKWKKERPEIVGLTVEQFFPPIAAKELAKEILREAGVSTIKLTADYEFQLSVIKNDHCYTPFTSPSQMKAKLAAEKQKQEAEKQATVVRTILPQNASMKQFLTKKKLQQSTHFDTENENCSLISQAKLEHKNKEEGKDKVQKLKNTSDEILQNYEDSFSSSAEDEEYDSFSYSEESAESDNDRDSDLDFDISNRKGRKRKVQLIKKTKRLIAAKNQNKRGVHNQDESDDIQRIMQKTKTAKIVNNPMKSITVPILKNPPAAISVTNLHKPLSGAISALPSIPKKSQTSAEMSIPQQTTITSIVRRGPVVQIGPTNHGVESQSSPQNVKEIVINKVIASPKGGFTDISALLTQTEKPLQTTPAKHIPTLRHQTQTTPSKGFMLLGADSATNNQLPAQISIQTHQSSSELAAEHDKQLDLIDSIVKNEMEKCCIIEKEASVNENIPELVKMLESTEQALESNKSSEKNTFTETTSVEALDIPNAPLNEIPEDDIPEDLLQHVVDLIEDDKTLQEEVEKQVFGEDGTESVTRSVSATTPPPLTPIHKLVQRCSTPHKEQDQEEAPTKSIIEISISNTTGNTPLVPPINVFAIHTPKPLVRKEPIQIVRGNGRVITLPPIEAPTTRAKRRAQTHPVQHDLNASLSNLNESSLDSSLQSNSSVTATDSEKKISNTLPKNRVIKDGIIVPCLSNKAMKKNMPKKLSIKKISLNNSKNESEAEASESQEDDDDPNKLWCVCRQPHNNRFMICCDVCEDWFHGTCVSITKAMGLEMEQKGIDWTCPKCIKKQEEKKQRKITDMLAIKKTPTTATLQKTLITENKNIEGYAPSTNILLNHQTVLLQKDLSKKPQIEIQKIQSRHFITLKDLQEAKKTPAAILSSGQKKFVTPSTSNQNAKDLQTLTSMPGKRIIFVQNPPSQKSEATSKSLTLNKSQYQQQQMKLKKDLTLSHKVKEPTLYCVFCKKEARANTVYCSDECIRKYAQSALNNYSVKLPEQISLNAHTLAIPDDSKKKSKGLFEDILSMADRKPKVERVTVFERKSGRILTGNSAPTTLNLKKWLQENPTFEVVQPGSHQAIEIEKRQRQRIVQSSITGNRRAVQHNTDVSPSNTLTKLTPTKSFKKTEVHITPIEASHILKPVKQLVEQPKPPTVNLRPNTPRQQQKTSQQATLKPAKNEEGSKIKEKLIKRQGTESGNKKPSENLTSSTNEEPIRLNVRRTLKEQLLLRVKEVETNNDVTVNAKQLTAEEVDDFITQTEAEMFNYFNRDTGSKYKAKYRSLMFNIKDRKNLTLFEKICAKVIEPKQLVRMSPDELASQELAQWRENEAKHQLEIIKKSELDLLSCAKNYVLKTHKGEEVIEGNSADCVNLDLTLPLEDVGCVLNQSTSSNDLVLKESSYKDHSNSLELETLVSHIETFSANTASILTKSEADRSKMSKKDREREHDNREHDRERRHKSKDHYKEKSRQRKHSRSRSRTRSRSREKRHKSYHRHERRDREDREYERERSRDKERVRERDRKEDLEKKISEKKTSLISAQSASKISVSSTKKEKQRENAATSLKKPNTSKPVEIFSLIDHILDSTKTIEEAANIGSEKESEVIRQSTPIPSQSTGIATHSNLLANATSSFPVQNLFDCDDEPTSTVTISTPPQDPYIRYSGADSPESSGNFGSPNTFWSGNINMIDVTSFQIILQPVVGNAMNLGKLLPEDLDVVGRIGPETVWDYISKIKKSPNKEISIIRLIPLSESETPAYTILYQYLDKRKRLGVIKTTSAQIKDFYIFPLGAGKQMPAILKTPEHVDFYDDSYRPDVLVGIVIRVIGKRMLPVPHLTSTTTSASTAKVSEKLSHFQLDRRINDIDSFTPPGSPKRKKTTHSTVVKEKFDIDAIIKAPIISKNTKTGVVATPTVDDADEPYSPGGSSDDDVPMMPVLPTQISEAHNTASEDLKRKMEEINRKIAAQEKEIAGLLIGEPPRFASASSTSTVLANISIPSNLSQILASIKSKPEPPPMPTQPPPVALAPPPPLIGSLIKTSTMNAGEEYTPDNVNSAYGRSGKLSDKPTSSRLAQLSEAELLRMVPDDMINHHQIKRSAQSTEEKKLRYEEPPPPGV